MQNVLHAKGRLKYVVLVCAGRARTFWRTYGIDRAIDVSDNASPALDRGNIFWQYTPEAKEALASERPGGWGRRRYVTSSRASAALSLHHLPPDPEAAVFADLHPNLGTMGLTCSACCRSN